MQPVAVSWQGNGWRQVHASPGNSDGDKVLTASASLLVCLDVCPLKPQRDIAVWAFRRPHRSYDGAVAWLAALPLALLSFSPRQGAPRGKPVGSFDIQVVAWSGRCDGLQHFHSTHMKRSCSDILAAVRRVHSQTCAATVPGFYRASSVLGRFGGPKMSVIQQPMTIG